MHVVKVCNPRHANFDVGTSARSGYWLFRDTTSYTMMAYKVLKTNLKLSSMVALDYMHRRERISMVALALTA